jgi:uncharacterized phage-like protein YoqJ
MSDAEKPFTIAFTGHRPDKLGGYGPGNPTRARLKIAVEQQLRQFRAEHPDLRCISGMALGFDQWAAEICVELGVPFVAAVPFPGQPSQWPSESQAAYFSLLKYAERVHVVCDGPYSAEKMQQRNEWMVDNCHHVLAAWDKSPGGTANCVRYANSVAKPVTNLLEMLSTHAER